MTVTFRRQHCIRAMGLPSVLALACLLFLVVFVLLGTVLSGHGLISGLENKTRARNLAEAAVKRCCLRLRNQSDYGLKPGEALTVTLPGDPAGSQGRVVFEGNDASLNNLDGQAAVSDSRGVPVPARSALLIGLGQCRSSQVRVEALLRRADFPYVLASQGPVESSGATRIGSLSSDTQSLLPGDLASNSCSDRAVALGPQSFVSGDLRSAGGLFLDPLAKVDGQTFLHASQVELPRIDLQCYDPLGRMAFQDIPTLTGNQDLCGIGRCSTDMTIQGHLRLQGASLFVNGDLLVTDGISGSGLLVVMGQTRVQQGIQLETSDRAVLLSGGHVWLTGVGARASQFHGLVYTQGGLTAQQLSLVGAFISSGSDQATLIQDANLAYDPQVSRLYLPTGSMLIPGSPSGMNVDLEPIRFSSQSARGAWVSSDSLTAGSATGLAFNLSDFLGQGQPLEVISWREDP